MAQSSPISTLINLFTTPKVALSALKEQPNFLFPLLLILITSALSIAYYFYHVDFAWMIDRMVEAQSAGKNADEIANIRKAMGAISPLVMGGGAVVGALIATPIVYAIVALYLLLANKVLDSEAVNFKSWFSLVCWTATPILFTTLASFMNVLLTSNGQVPLESINPISFNSLFLHLTSSDKLFGPLNSWDPMTIWNLVLAVLGYSVWTQKTLIKSAAIVLAPTIIIYGIWIFIALK